jgi:hypothetical protein
MARGIHGLPKVSPRPAMPDPSMPCRRATPETALCPFWVWPTRRTGSLRPSSIPLDTPRRTGLVNSFSDGETDGGTDGRRNGSRDLEGP